MTNTLKFTLAAALVAAALSAQAGPGFLFNVEVTKGRSTGTMAALRAHDSRLFRVSNTPLVSSEVDWTCHFFRLGNPTNLSHVEIRIHGSRSGGPPIRMLMFDHISQRWSEVATIALPRVGIGEYFLRIRRAPERFVSFNGRAQIRFRSTFQTMIIDQLTLRSVHN